ncbi:hypothetical protein [Streptomyces indicus]|uniref:NAD(P)H-flavin reductase n=1 Tax=Streptomyces indicus TaxID=417292 RepID=A0A1G8ZWU0_9ACTN|nr:hypothetical protein [Streptomyces indicus]SDK19104.1 NAD(P)H-flavin reductase [Streptomyces indicus]
MNTVPYRVLTRWEETPDAATLRLESLDEPLPGFVAGQYVRVGHRALPVSALPTTGGLGLTVCRADGLLFAARAGAVLELRGPYGTGWHLEKALGHDLLVMEYGIGLASLRPLIRDAVADPRAYGHLNVLIGGPDPEGLMARHETRRWTTSCTACTVDRIGPGWYGATGPVHAMLDRALFDAGRTSAFVCAPDDLLRASAIELLRRGISADRIMTGALTAEAPAAPLRIRRWGARDA